jgi:hypothetical protein
VNPILSFILLLSPAPTSTGGRRVLFQCRSWAHKFAVFSDRISIVSSDRFGIRGPLPLPPAYQVRPALGVLLGGNGVGGGDTQGEVGGKRGQQVNHSRLQDSGPPMMYEKPHFMRPAFHLGIALHADMVLRNVDLYHKRNTVSQWFYGGCP